MSNCADNRIKTTTVPSSPMKIKRHQAVRRLEAWSDSTVAVGPMTVLHQTVVSHPSASWFVSLTGVHAADGSGFGSRSIFPRGCLFGFKVSPFGVGAIATRTISAKVLLLS